MNTKQNHEQESIKSINIEDDIFSYSDIESLISDLKEKGYEVSLAVKKKKAIRKYYFEV